MSRINVNIENLEVAVANFVYASKETEEINYRLKQLGNELADDIDLLASPEYEAIMEDYTKASNAISRINEIFGSLVNVLIKAPEMYFNAENENIERIRALVIRTKEYQKAVADDSALSEIIEEAKSEDINVDGLADKVNKGYQSVLMADLASGSIDADSFEKAETLSGNVADRVFSDFNSVDISEISISSSEISDDSFEKAETLSGNVADRVFSDFNSIEDSEISIASNENNDKEER